MNVYKCDTWTNEINKKTTNLKKTFCHTWLNVPTCPPVVKKTLIEKCHKSYNSERLRFIIFFVIFEDLLIFYKLFLLFLFYPSPFLNMFYEFVLLIFHISFNNNINILVSLWQLKQLHQFRFQVKTIFTRGVLNLFTLWKL